MFTKNNLHKIDFLVKIWYNKIDFLITLISYIMMLGCIVIDRIPTNS